MLLLLDIGNTHTHVGLANARRVLRRWDLPTADWFNDRAQRSLRTRLRRVTMEGAALCSVVPRAVPYARRAVRDLCPVQPLLLSPATVRDLGIDYPRPDTIGPDRLANAVAARARFGAPVVVVDFGTAVTFDVVNRSGDYIGGIIAPGLSAMTDYLHEKTALLPRIRIRPTNAAVGRNTEEAMLIGAVHGYRGLVRELIGRLKRELRARHLPVVATGGYAALVARGLPEIAAVEPGLTLEGLRLVWMAQHAAG
jgi:type III pantothenate kinase